MPSRTEIKPLVVEKLAAISDKKNSIIGEADHLEHDLGLVASVRYAMGFTFSKITKKYPGGLAVPMSRTKSLKTVKATIDLVTARANGKKA